MKLSQLISQYVAFRKGLGEDFESQAWVLKSFSRAMGKSTHVADVKAHRVKVFLDGRGPITRYWHKKHNVLLGFYRYAWTRKYVSEIPLPPVVPKLPPRFIPYIYSLDELRRLIAGTASYQKQRILMEPVTFRTILLVLYGAGLRVSECLSLTLADVDLRQSLLVIRNTKFYKSRLVPLGADLSKIVLRYAQQRNKQKGHSQVPTAPFFVTKAGNQVPIRLLQRAFRRLRKQCSIRRKDGARYEPRLHDLRHAFAVNRLTSWYQEGKDVQKLLPQLATYMGHKDIISTQVYLTITPQLLGEANTRFAGYAFGEVSHA
jgi:site-specific recombinase XerD